MKRVVEDTASAELWPALEANMAAFWSAYGRAEGCTLQVTSEAVWFYTGIPVPLFNGVLSANLKPEGVKATVDALQAKIDTQHAPAFWWIGPQSKPDNLGAILELHGLQFAGAVPGMAIDLALVKDAPETIANFTIRKVINAEMQKRWAQIAAVGTEFPPEAVEAMARVEAALTGPQYQRQYRYIGYLQGTPVATAALVLEAGVAGIYAVATIPEARRQGIGRIMTVRPLFDAMQAGYRVGILQASPMGYPIYERIGFRALGEYQLYLQSGKDS
jgi:ribosomal protein S18 acetylase RimI-like enzyme